MTSLDDLGPEDTELVCALPFMAGVLVSYADDVEGEDDDESEMIALEACLQAAVKARRGHALTKAILEKTLAQRAEWECWAEACDSAPATARKAIAIVLRHGGEAAAKDYRSAVLEITTAVAEAYGEFGQFDEADTQGFFGTLMARFAGMGGEDRNHPMNVSAAEDSAIGQLAAALKI